MAYLLFFLSGLFGANALPHLTKGIIGERHMTPFSKPSGPVVNILWAFTNIALATACFYGGYHKPTNDIAAVICGLVGAFCMSLICALLWRNDDRAKGR